LSFILPCLSRFQTKFSFFSSIYEESLFFSIGPKDQSSLLMLTFNNSYSFLVSRAPCRGFLFPLCGRPPLPLPSRSKVSLPPLHSRPPQSRLPWLATTSPFFFPPLLFPAASSCPRARSFPFLFLSLPFFSFAPSSGSRPFPLLARRFCKPLQVFLSEPGSRRFW